jgi:glycosyltransferase involved in cell wall biosynthesis
MRALIVDPALRSRGGHHYNATLRLKNELARLGVEHECLTSSFADQDVVQDLAATPCFDRCVYGRTEWTYQAFVQDVAETGRQLSEAVQRLGRNAPDLLILPCCDQVLALALAKHLQRRRSAPAPRVVLWLLYAPHCKKALDDPSVADLYGEYREAFTALKAAVGDDERIVAHCETELMAQAYRGVTGLDIAVAPGPSLIPVGDTSGETRPGDPPTVACIGFANEAKGYHLLPGAVGRVLKEHRDVRFLIHGVVQGTDAEANAAVFDALSKLGDRVTTRTDVLTQEDYQSWLGSADVLLLPYDPAVYRSRGSGVFTEAHRLGIPVIAPRGCAFAAPAFDGGWGIEIVDRSERGVAEAVLSALTQLVPLTGNARAAIAAAGSGDTASILDPVVRAIRSDKPAGMTHLGLWWRMGCPPGWWR